MGFGKDNKGVIITEEDVITVGALADNAAVKQGTPLAMTDRFRIIKTEYEVFFDNVTANDHIDFGIASDELSVTEIAEAIQLNGPLSRAQIDEGATALRPVWLLDGVVGGGNMALWSKGEKTLRWTFGLPGWSFFAYNHQGSPITTAAILRFTAKHFGVWVE